MGLPFDGDEGGFSGVLTRRPSKPRRSRAGPTGESCEWELSATPGGAWLRDYAERRQAGRCGKVPIGRMEKMGVAWVSGGHFHFVQVWRGAKSITSSQSVDVGLRLNTLTVSRKLRSVENDCNELHYASNYLL